MGKNLPTTKLLILDCDGVLTNGIVPCRQFNVKDGIGIKKLQSTSIKLIVVSGATHPSIKERLEYLGITDYYLGQQDKLKTIYTIIDEHNIEINNITYMGDDTNDLVVKNIVGVLVAPKDAIKEVRNKADYVTKLNGGCGCVRELIDLILKERDKHNEINNIESNK